MKEEIFFEKSLVFKIMIKTKISENQMLHLSKNLLENRNQNSKLKPKFLNERQTMGTIPFYDGW